MSIPDDATLFIDHAEHLGDYQLRLTFNDHTQRVIDFGPFLRDSRNPHIQSYLDRARFAAFAVTHGDLVWGDYDLCFPVADLYDGHV